MVGDIYDPQLAILLTGVVLDVKPTVSHDRRYITLELRPQTADAILNIQTITAAGSILVFQLPQVLIRSVRTTATVPDGGTLLISGLMSNHSFDANSGIPVVSDLPILGRLFGTDLKQREKRNLLILVTGTH